MLAVSDLVELLPRPPIPPLPGHLAVARHRIPHRPHAAHEERCVRRGKGEGVDAAAVVMALRRPPGGEVGRGKATFRLSAAPLAELPHPHLAEHVRGGKMEAVAAEATAEHRRLMVERRDDIAARGVKHFDPRLGRGSRLVLPAPGKVLPRATGDPAAVGGKGEIPAPKAMRRHSPRHRAYFEVVPQQLPVVAAGDERLSIGEQRTAAGIRAMHPRERHLLARGRIDSDNSPIGASGKGAAAVGGKRQAKDAGGKHGIVEEGELHRFTPAIRRSAPSRSQRGETSAIPGDRTRRGDRARGP